MVRLKWTFALIIISVPILATVITAFRLRDLHKTTHEGYSEIKKKYKCENCDVNERKHSYKIESDVEELKKPVYDKYSSVNKKAFDRVPKYVSVEIDEEYDDDEDENNDNLSYLRQLASKWQDKLKASGLKSDIEVKPQESKKKQILISTKDVTEDEVRDDERGSALKTKKKEHNRKIFTKIPEKDIEEDFIDESDDKDEDESDIEDEDNVNEKNLPENVDNSLTNKNTSGMPISQTKILNTEKVAKVNTNNNIKSDTKNRNENIESEIRTKKKETKLIAKLIEDEKIEKKIDQKEKDIKMGKQENIKVPLQEKKEKINKQKLTKEIPQNKLEENKLEKEANEIMKGDKKKESKSTLPSKPTEENVKSKDKTITVNPNTKNTLTNINMDIQTDENHDENYLKQVSDALNRRNLLQSEFEDFYTFFPTFAPNFSRAHDPECRRHGKILLRQLRGSKLWALNMLDATAKIPSGILQGNGIQLGDFDQCLGSRARVQLDTGSIVKVQGKYCLARIEVKAEHPELEIPVHLAQAKSLIKSKIDDPGHFVPRFSTLSWGICVPSACNPEDVEGIVRDSIKHYQYRSGISIRVKVDPNDCYMQKKQSWWQAWCEIPTIVTLSFYAVVVMLVVVATIKDFLAERATDDINGKETNDNAECDQNETDSDEKKSHKEQSGENIITVFSLYRTTSKLMAPATTDEISCIHGVRAIATIALLVAHKFLPVAVMPYTNRVKITETVSSPLWSWCRAGWMYTDCFLLLSGTLMAHRMSTEKESGAIRRIFFRYLRLTPALLAVVLFYAYVWDNVSSGPMWGELVTKNAEVCQEGWWWNIIYVQNYFSFESMCAPQTHQLALDMQLTILGGVIIWTMQSEAPMLKAVLPALHVWAGYSRYTMARNHRLTLLAYHGVSVSQLYRTARLSYTSVVHRSTPYLVGLSLGLALKNHARHNKILIALGWLTSGVLWALVWWAGFDSGSTQYRYNVIFAAQYASLAPIASSLAIAWLIYAVHSGHCDFLYNLLCSRPLTLISRLSYALYLCQFIVFLTSAATVRTASEFTLISLIDVQEICLILLSSVLVTLVFVIPMQSLPRLFSLSSKNENNDNRRNIESLALKVNEQTLTSSNKDEKRNEPPTIRSRQTLIAHREILEEIPEAEIEYEHQRSVNENLRDILEEEEDEDNTDGRDRQDEEDLEIIEEEQEGEDDFWENRHGDDSRRTYSRSSDRDFDEWELTANENGTSGSQQYRYSR